MKKFRLPRKEKKVYTKLDFMGILHSHKKNRCVYIKYWQNIRSKYFEYSQAGYKMLKAVRKETQPYKNSLWGSSHVNTDKLTPYMEGDGLQLVRVVTLSSRPFGYLVRIDSKHNVFADNFDIEIMLENIEEYYGSRNDFEEMEIDGRFVYVYNEDIDDNGNVEEDAYIREDEPFNWDGGSWNTRALTKINHLRTVRQILAEIQKAVSEEYYRDYGLCYFINEYSPTGTAEEIYRLVELATGIDLDNVDYQWNRFNESDFKNRLEYLKAHYQQRIDIIDQTIEYCRKEVQP